MKIISLALFILCFIIIPTSSAFADISDAKGVSISLVNQDPDPAIAGDVMEIYLGIENIGGESANDLMVEFVPEYPFTLATDEPAVQNIGTMKSYQYDDYMKIITYTIKVDSDASAGSYDLKIRYYEFGDSKVIEKSITIDVKNREMAEIIQIDKTNLVPGKQSGLTFTVNNVGKAPLRDLTFSWINEDKVILPVGSDNTKYIKNIEIGDSVDLDYQVIADPNADPGLYELKLYLTYDNPITYEEKEISTIAGVNVGGGTDFEVAFSDNSGTETSFSIANIGSNPAYSVSVIVPRQNGWEISGSNSVIIGNLNKGDYTVASFNLRSIQQVTDLQIQDVQADSKQIPGERLAMQESNSLIVQIAYTDTMGERKVIEKDVTLSPQNIDSDMVVGIPGRRNIEQQSALETYKWYIAVFILLVIGVVLHKKYKRRKLIDPQFQIKDIFRGLKKNS